MKVLNKLPKDADLTKYKFLSTKVVYDWRHRESEWRRRGRLVAREFRWLGDTDIASLFSPTGVASTVKLLSALFSSSEGYSLGSIDVGDAYLMVEQKEPTVVEVDGEYYELGFTLPGQRIGSSAWFNKLKGYLEEYGMPQKQRDILFHRAKPQEGYPVPQEGGAGRIHHDVHYFLKKITGYHGGGEGGGPSAGPPPPMVPPPLPHPACGASLWCGVVRVWALVVAPLPPLWRGVGWVVPPLHVCMFGSAWGVW